MMLKDEKRKEEEVEEEEEEEEEEKEGGEKTVQKREILRKNAERRPLRLTGRPLKDRSLRRGEKHLSRSRFGKISSLGVGDVATTTHNKAMLKLGGGWMPEF
ncbi:hypothetical protein HZH68_005086 [Vespula germanica]|uniref:Uncharacterized protein n=1 Tax=Vespula germanica TaxID=30212 RepID=A0A834KGW8_VESGE|nr:hypothetical protein HZH68_005086 [Vespula germanica]